MSPSGRQRIAAVPAGWSALCAIFSSFPAQTGVENPPINVCRDSISGIVGNFQSAKAFPGQRALTIECSPMVGLVKAMNL